MLHEILVQDGNSSTGLDFSTVWDAGTWLSLLCRHVHS